MVVAAAPQSQSLVGRANANKQHGIVGMFQNPYVFLTCLFASLGCMMYGYDQGVMSSVLVMENFEAHFPTLTGTTIQGWLVASLELGAWFGALLNGWLADQISRKYSMLVAVLVFTLGTGLQAGAQSPAYLFAGRVIGGVGIGMFSMVLSITFGTAVAFWVDYGMHFVGGTSCNPAGVSESVAYPDGNFDYYAAHGHTCTGEKSVSWRFPLALQLVPAWILFFGMFFLPFSPRWLMMKHRDDDAINALCRLRRLQPDDPLLRAEYLEIKAAVMFDEESEMELVGKHGWTGPWRLLFSPSIFKRLAIGCSLMIFQQFTGVNSVLYYAPQIFESFGLTSTTTDLLATGVTGILQVLFTIPAVLFLDKFGRKTFLIVGAAGMCVCHVIVAAIDGTYEDSWSTHTAEGWVSVAFIWLFAVNFAYSWGPVTWVLAQEIFPASVRSRGVSIVASTNWMFNFVIGLTTKDMLASMKFGTYIFFAAFCGGGGLFVWWFVPETKNKTLEELDIYFGGSESNLAIKDKERMQRINESLGLAGIQDVNDIERKGVDDHLHQEDIETKAE